MRTFPHEFSHMLTPEGLRILEGEANNSLFLNGKAESQSTNSLSGTTPPPSPASPISNRPLAGGCCSGRSVSWVTGPIPIRALMAPSVPFVA